MLTGFPRWSLTPTRTLYRAHRRDLSPWWFSSDLSGRFDLIAPEGTCYLASTQATAARERWGERLVRAGRVSAADADATIVSRLTVPASVALADTCARRAALLGVTREIGTLTPYAVPQAWAAAFTGAGFDGVRYESRFTTGARDRAYAIFGPAGAGEWAIDTAPVDGRQAAAAAEIFVMPAPYSLPTIRPADR